jgi:hypothetical protein
MVFTLSSKRWIMTKIGDFAPLEQPHEMPAESAIPVRAQSIANVPLDAFPADEILPPQGPVLNLEGTSRHLPAVAAATADKGPAETQHAPREISPADELTSERQLELQQLLEKKTQIESTPSNVLKPFDDDQRDLVANIK